ncbi:acyltransferase domain-containing protein, partial [Nocardia amikacinitolerans]|uniref:acyltransferase domain-containing protein n=1 Tax=Nocardia amikacinitolerans TaxID=756689 RepID=UPI0014719CE9
MGVELYHAYPTFAAALDDACAALDPHLDKPLRDLLFASPDSDHARLLNDTRYTQPALFALHVALYRLLTSVGPIPAHLAGHSIGELAVAHVAAILSLDDAATLVAARARLMHQHAVPGGAMIAIAATADEITTALQSLDPTGDHLAIAAVNSPTNTVISGEATLAHTLADHFRGQGRKTRVLTVSHAFHSPHMRPVLDPFRAVAATLTYHSPTIPIVSTLTGTLADPHHITTPDYWVDHIHSPVRYLDAIDTLTANHTTTYLELGPDPTLTSLTTDIHADTTAPQPTILPTLRPRTPEPDSLLTTLAKLHTTGHPIGFHHLRPNPAHTPRTELPTYPFQHHSYWLTPTPSTHTTVGAGLRPTNHPILTATTDLPDG